MMVIALKHAGAVLMLILSFFQSNSLVHQIINKDFHDIKMHGTTVKKKRIKLSQTGCYFCFQQLCLWVQ